MSEKELKKPIKKLRIGRISLTVWGNEIEKDGKTVEFSSSVIEKNYKVGEEWKKTSNLSDSDLRLVSDLIAKHLSSLVKED